MPNPIKYSTGSETLALKKGNFYIGTGDVGKGPTSSTGYYNGITPPTGGYTIYLNKTTGGPSIYTVTSDAQLISLTNSIAGESYTEVNQCLVYFAGQTDKLCVNRDYEGIVTDGLVFNVDAGFTPSYPKTGTTIYDVSSGGYNGVLTNGPTFSTDNGGSIVLDGVDDYIQISETTFNYSSISGWIKTTTTSGEQNIISGFMIAEVTIRGNIGIQNGYLVWTRGTKRRYTLRQVNDGDWHHFHLNKNSITDFNMYIDGELSNFDSTVSNVRLSERAVIGCRVISGTPSLFFDGQISNIQIYNRVLTASEILQNYNAQKGRFGL